jgi:predicted DNA-binding protein
MDMARKLNGSKGKQISLRLPTGVLEKLERLAQKSVQTKAQWIMKAVMDARE